MALVHVRDLVDSEVGASRPEQRKGGRGRRGTCRMAWCSESIRWLPTDQGIKSPSCSVLEREKGREIRQPRFDRSPQGCGPGIPSASGRGRGRGRGKLARPHAHAHTGIGTPTHTHWRVSASASASASKCKASSCLFSARSCLPNPPAPSPHPRLGSHDACSASGSGNHAPPEGSSATGKSRACLCHVLHIPAMPLHVCLRQDGDGGGGGDGGDGDRVPPLCVRACVCAVSVCVCVCECVMREAR